MTMEEMDTLISHQSAIYLAHLCSDPNGAYVSSSHKEIVCMIKKAEINYKDKVEEKLKTGNANDPWRGLSKMMGRQQKPAAVQCDDAFILSNELNEFYSRFDKYQIFPVNLQEMVVLSVLRGGVNPHKAPGPDRLKAKALKECAAQLAPVFTQMLQLFLNVSFVPRNDGRALAF